MSMKSFAVVALIVVTSGCHWKGFREDVHSHETFEDLVAQLGVPDKSVEVGENTAHEWDIYDRGGRWRCRVTATAKDDGALVSVRDNCPKN